MFLFCIMIPPLLSYANVRHSSLHTYKHVQTAHKHIHTCTRNNNLFLHVKGHNEQLYGTQQSGSFILEFLKI